MRFVTGAGNINFNLKPLVGIENEFHNSGMYEAYGQTCTEKFYAKKFITEKDRNS